MAALKKRLIFLGVATITVVLVAFFALNNYFSTGVLGDKKPFYVGVTYCGNTIQDAKLLVDKVKNYTNLLVLQSGSLMTNETAVKEIGDYAVSCGLHFAVFFESGNNVPSKAATWLEGAKQWWGNMFVGIYLGDEPGGKMLDGRTTTFMLSTNESINISTDGTITYYDTLQYYATYYPNGNITVTKTNGTSVFIPNLDDKTITTEHELFNTTTYNTNGSITFHEVLIQTTIKGNVPNSKVLRENYYTKENGSDYIAQLETYQQVKSKNPIPDCDTAADLYIYKTKKPIDNLRNQWNISKGDFPIFTSDYALYWWDYKSGYDMVLAQLGWNNSVAQEIGLVRGAANLQDKSWGTIITWTYTKPPYLTNGNEMFEQMRISYESGADYVIIFNYAEDMEAPFGTLKEEHFEALEGFWNNVVHNSTVVHGGIKAEAAFVFPKNYGYGLRRIDDSVWGLWEPTIEVKKAWSLLQEAVTKNGLKLDIVYDDAAYSLAGKYCQVYYWNQTR